MFFFYVIFNDIFCSFSFLLKSKYTIFSQFKTPLRHGKGLINHVQILRIFFIYSTIIGVGTHATIRPYRMWFISTNTQIDVIFEYVCVCVCVRFLCDPTVAQTSVCLGKVVCLLCGLTFDVSKTVRFGRHTKAIPRISLMRIKIKFRVWVRIGTFVYDNNGR